MKGFDYFFFFTFGTQAGMEIHQTQSKNLGFYTVKYLFRKNATFQYYLKCRAVKGDHILFQADPDIEVMFK